MEYIKNNKSWKYSFRNEYAIQGMLFARSQTLEQLVYHLKNDFVIFFVSLNVF